MSYLFFEIKIQITFFNYFLFGPGLEDLNKYTTHGENNQF